MPGIEAFESIADEPQKMPLLHPRTLEVYEEGGDEMYVMLLGQDSSAFTRVEKAQRTRTFGQYRQNQNLAITADRIDEEEFQRTFACMTAWHIYYGGEWIDGELTERKVKEVFKRAPWIYKQIQNFIKNDQNFLARPPEPSSNMHAGFSGSKNPEGKTNLVQPKSGKGMNGGTDSLTPTA